MPIQAISIGPATPILQNVVYALPAKPVLIGSVVAIEVSIDGVGWSAYVAGQPAVGKFLRCTVGNTTVMCTAFSGTSGGGGGGGLTNPIVEPVEALLTLISQTLVGQGFANLGLHVDDETHGLDIWMNNAIRSVGGGPLSANYSNPDGPHVFYASGTEILRMAFDGLSTPEGVRFSIKSASIPTGDAEDVELLAGDSDNGDGGEVQIRGGFATGPGNTGGAVTISGGNGVSGASKGDVSIDGGFIGLSAPDDGINITSGDEIRLTSINEVNLNPAGQLQINSSPGINAAITTASLSGKTITVTKGIITGFA